MRCTVIMYQLAVRRNIGVFRILNKCRYCTKVSKQEQKCSRWQPVIGLEVHAQIAANSKLFSGSATKFAAPINSQVSAFDASLPGTLPVLNRRCAEAGVQTALALQCSINLESEFDRKHYFYADLPTGYQITQQRRPLAACGHVDYLVYSHDKKAKPRSRTARIVQLQLEQDSGKSLHDAEMSVSLIDLNRAGVGLIEIITEPDFISSEEAVCFVRELQLILQTIGTCDGRMEEGSLRVDASVSVHRSDEPLGIRAEIKNLNSIRSLGKAIDFEIARQITILEEGGEVVNETRTFIVDTGKTVSLRDKERLHDYRFLPEPNLPPLRLHTRQTMPVGTSSEQIINVDHLRDHLPELPSAKRLRLQQTYGLSLDYCNILVNEPGLVECYEQIVNECKRNPTVTANVCMNEVFTALNKYDISFLDSGLTAERIGQLVDMILQKTVALSTARQVIEIMLNDDGGKTPQQIVDEHGWSMVTDEVILFEICSQVLSDNEKAVSDYKAGKTKTFNFLVGQVQKQLNGRADGKAVTAILQRQLSNDS